MPYSLVDIILGTLILISFFLAPLFALLSPLAVLSLILGLKWLIQKRRGAKKYIYFGMADLVALALCALFLKDRFPSGPSW